MKKMNSKKIGSLLLAAIMVILILTATPVSAKNEEMCHWEQVSGEGFGDLANDYAWSYLNHLYARGYCEDNDQWGIGDMAIVKPTVASSIGNISIVPLLVNKTVCDPKTHEWVDELNVSASNVSSGDTLRFRCEVHNNATSGLPLTYTLVWDFLSNGLEYAGDATVRYPFGYTIRREPDYVGPLTVRDHTIGTVFIYFFPFLKLEPSENIIIEYNAKVGTESVLLEGYKAINTQFAGGYFNETELGFGYDSVPITEPVWECDTSLPVGTIIENSAAETSARPHRMNHALAR